MIAELDAVLATCTSGMDRIEAAVARTFARAWEAAGAGPPLDHRIDDARAA